MSGDNLSQRVRSLIAMAVLAPSSHNTQPWRFRVAGLTIDVLADRSRSLPVNDPEDRELSLSCGCALLNLRVAAAAEGLAARTRLLPDPQAPDWLARVTLARLSAATSEDAELAPQIGRRRTHRQGFAPREVDPRILDRMGEAARVEGARLHLLLGETLRAQVGELVAEGDAVQWSDGDWRRELAAWMRPHRRGDGLTVPALVVPITRLLVRGLDMGRQVGTKNRRLAETAPLLAVLTTREDRPRDWLTAGQALQRLLLLASREGLQAAYLNQPIQVASLRPRLQGLTTGGLPQMLLCLGYPTGESRAAPRRPVEAVIQWAGGEEPSPGGPRGLRPRTLGSTPTAGS